MTFGDHEYDFTLASDVGADGMSLELDDVTGGDRETLAAVFHSDVDGSMRFTAYRRDLPLAAVEYLVAEARRRLPPAPADTSS